MRVITYVTDELGSKKSTFRPASHADPHEIKDQIITLQKRWRMHMLRRLLVICPYFTLVYILALFEVMLAIYQVLVIDG